MASACYHYKPSSTAYICNKITQYIISYGHIEHVRSHQQYCHISLVPRHGGGRRALVPGGGGGGGELSFTGAEEGEENSRSRGQRRGGELSPPLLCTWEQG